MGSGKHAHAAPIKGVVKSVGPGSLQIQTQSGMVSVQFTGSTHVTKIVSGTTADLAPDARVTLQLAAGTTTVTAVQVEPAFTKPASARPSKTNPHAAGSRSSTKSPRKSTTSGTTSKHTWTGTRTHIDGQIVTSSGSTLSLRGRGGQTLTFALASNATITKATAGTTSDLAAGETVEVIAPTGGAAVAITILSA
jgi:hypothetical protein